MTLCLLPSARALAQPAAGSPQDESGRQYLSLVEAYRQGDDAALERLRALWTQDETAHRAIALPRHRALAPVAIVMHCTLAVRAAESGGTDAMNRQLAVAGRIAALDHLRLLDAPSQAIAARRGYYVLGVWLSTARLRLVPARLRDAFEAFPDDPELLLAQGSYEETFLNPAIPRPDAPLAHVQIYAPPASEAAVENPAANALTGRMAQIQHRTLTARWFERSLARNPASPATALDARLRLAHLRMVAESWKDARKELEAVHAQLARLDSGQRARVRRLEYLAQLFSGRAAGQARDWPTAARAYQQASLLCPVAQTARIGHSHALLMAGDEPAARGVALELLGPAARVGPARPSAAGGAADTCGEDPWSEYTFGQRWRVDDLLAEMNAAVRS